jgi:hypothetical protein
MLGVTKQAHGHSLHLLPRGYTVTLALRVWVCLTSYCTLTLFKGSPVSGGRVVRAYSQPQGMFLHFETRRSGVGECARPW